MLLSNENILKRMNNSSNLANGSRGKAMSLFGVSKRVETVKEAEIVVDKEDIPIEFNSSVLPDEKKTESFNPFAKYAEEVQKELEISTKPEISVTDLVPNADEEISLATAESSAVALMTDAITTLRLKLDDIRADKLPSVISAAAKTVEGIRRERNDNKKNNKEQDVHYHFYVPEQRKIADYAVVEVA